jgi:hypothetical protein
METRLAGEHNGHSHSGIPHNTAAFQLVGNPPPNKPGVRMGVVFHLPLCKDLHTHYALLYIACHTHHLYRLNRKRKLYSQPRKAR